MLRTNFFKTVLASMLVVCATAFHSCDSDGEGPGDEGTTSESAIIGKWEVSDGGNTRASGDTKYGSFEFTADNKYIITQPAVTTSGEKYMLVIFGDYVVGNNESNDFTLNLKEFGIIKISINKTSASITIDGVVYVAVKAKEVDTSDKTKLLCGTWKESHYIDAEGNREDNDDDGYQLVFTESGTYYFRETEPEEETGFYVDYGIWEFVGDNKIMISGSDWDSSIGGEVETKDYGTIVKLTATKLVIKYDEGDTAYLYR